MKNQPEFVQQHLRAAKLLLKINAEQEPVFSRGTYQIEIQDNKRKKYFPFLQIQDSGEVSESFCSCDQGKNCIHLAVSYLKIFNGFDEPLHVRFRKSFWNRLFQMASKRHGYDTAVLKKEEKGGFFCESKTKKKLFSIEAKTAAAKKKLELICAERAQETEETSLKFSNWSADEIARFRSGQASHALLYEFSFWSDLAKWLMFLQECQEPYQIAFVKEALPSEITIKFPHLKVWFYIAEVNWPWLIPSLNTVDAPLKTYEQEEKIEHIQFDPEKQCLFIQHQQTKTHPNSPFSGIGVGDWIFVENKGFYRKKNSPLFKNDTIPKEKIGEILSSSHKELQPFLPIYPDPIPAKYQLHFDTNNHLHIELYVFQPGDIRDPLSSCFIPWIYLVHKGFYRISDWLFEGQEKIVPQQEIADFINRHRLWLQTFPGFHTHIGSLESHLIYHLSAEGELTFEAALNFPEGFEEARHFGEWVYVPGQGFYMKRDSASRFPLHPGQRVTKKELSSFIASHKEELEQVQGFFNPQPVIIRTGLFIHLNEEKRICVTPKREYAANIDENAIQFFGDFLYIEGHGFSEIPFSSRLPEKYRETQIIPPAQESAFLTYELEPLKPFILSIDSQLTKPSWLKAKLQKIAKETRKGVEHWLIDLVYESELGTIDPISIWDACQQHKKYLFSPAGLFFLQEPRFHWIRSLNKASIDRTRGAIRLTTLEWMRLTIFEELQAPKGQSPEVVRTRKLLEELHHLETHRLLDISKLKATLRPYQEQGLQWLWFLYCHNLSGLLCDDMGLGKTHQAMALLAAVSHEDLEQQNKYLVVCPTSVIYHWEDLLKRFLPKCKVLTYYGVARNLVDFESHYQILLTSYGILRTGKESLKTFPFEVAIFDEIQIAKNFASQTHKALREMHAKMRLGLSGTPIENRLRELKALIDIALPSYLPPDPIFREMFINPIEKQNDEGKKQLLARLVKPFVLRRRKSEVLTDLPEKIEEIAYCDLTNEQKELYKEVGLKMRETVYQELKCKEKPIPYMHVFAALTHFKQICDHPAIYLKDPKKYGQHSSGKWELFTELLTEALGSGQKIVVFSQYLDMLSIMESYCKDKGIHFASIKGSTRNRNEQLQKFKEDPNCSVFLASLLAAGVGIDLTVASIVIHYDRWWNPAKENQATDRVHRIGQNRGVQVFKFVTKNTIEEDIHRIIEAKKGLLESIVGTEDQITYLSREELLAVFEKMFVAL